MLSIALCIANVRLKEWYFVIASNVDGGCAWLSNNFAREFCSKVHYQKQKSLLIASNIFDSTLEIEYDELN